MTMTMTMKVTYRFVADVDGCNDERHDLECF